MNKIDFILSLSEYSEKFIITNVKMGRLGHNTIHKHLAEWINKSDEEHCIIVNTIGNHTALYNAGVPEKNLMLRKTFTQSRKFHHNRYDFMKSCWSAGNLILFDITDLRLLDGFKFKFSLSSLINKKKIVRNHLLASGHSNPWTWERIHYFSDEDEKDFNTMIKRIENIGEILEDV